MKHVIFKKILKNMGFNFKKVFFHKKPCFFKKVLNIFKEFTVVNLIKVA